jgi:hypothetical protein
MDERDYSRLLERIAGRKMKGGAALRGLPSTAEGKQAQQRRSCEQQHSRTTMGIKCVRVRRSRVARDDGDAGGARGTGRIDLNAATAFYAAVVLALAIPACLSVLIHRQAWPRLRSSAIAFCISEILQLVFVICAGMDWVALHHSRVFAAVGAPCCVVAVVLGVKGRNIGAVISACLSMLGWLFFVSVH